MIRTGAILALLILGGCASQALRKENIALREQVGKLTEVFRRQNAELEAVQKREASYQETIRQAMQIVGAQTAKKGLK